MNSSRLKLYKIIALILFCATIRTSVSQAAAQAEIQNQLIHFPITLAQAGCAIQLEAKLDGNDNILYSRIYYRLKGEAAFQYLEMDQSLEGFTGAIPAELVKAPAMEYYISLVAKSGQRITSPASNPYYSPHIINVNEKSVDDKSPADSVQNEIVEFSEQQSQRTGSDTLKIDFMILSPDPGEIIHSPDIVIAAALIPGKKGIVLKSIRLFLDGKNVTSLAQIAHGVVSYLPLKLKSGQHKISLRYKTKHGKKHRELKWKFYLSGTKSPAATGRLDSREKMLRGNAFIDLKNESISERKLETYIMGGRFHGKYRFLKYNSRLYLTSLENETSQPRNRYSIGLDGGWFGVNFGDTNPRFNDLTLWGRRVRGINAFIKTRLINFEFVTGEIRRGVNGVNFNDYKLNYITGDTLYYNPATSDTVNNGTVTEFSSKPLGYEYVIEEKPSVYGTYQRTLTGFRPSFGSGENFQLGFNLVKVKDQVSSITIGMRPKDNLVLGSDLLIAADNHRIELKSTIAFSLLTDDITPGALTKAGVDEAFDTSIPFDPVDFEKYFTLNTSTIPLDPSGNSSLAYNLKLRLNYFKNSVYIVYKSLGSEYNALGNAYLKTDIKGISINDRLRLFDNRFLLSLGYDKYDDNFSENDNNPITELSTFRINASIFPANQFPKIILSYRSHNRDNGLTDTTSVINYAIKNNTDDMSVMLSYDLNFMQQNHSFNITYMCSDRVDGLDRKLQNLSTNIMLVALRTRYQSPLTTYISFATTENVATGGSYKFKYNMFDLRADYYFLQKKMKAYAGIKNIAATTTGSGGVNCDYIKKYFNLGINYQITSKHSLFFDGNLINYAQNGMPNSNDTIFRLRYDFRY